MNNIEFYCAKTCKQLLCCCYLLLSTSIARPALAQEPIQFDIKTGLTFARFSGPAEELSSGRDLEDYNFNAGFHLALGASYPLGRHDGLRAELFFSQNGTNYEFNGISYWFFPTENGEAVFSFGARNEDLEIINSYLVLPVMYYLRTNRVKVSLGAGVGYLLTSRAEGKLTYSGLTESGSRVSPFTIDLRFDYLNDAFEHSFPPDGRTRVIDGQTVQLPEVIGAYFESSGEQVHRFRRWDAQLLGNISFFLSDEIFLSLRITYGLNDITDDRQDVSLLRVEADKTPVFTHDFDRNLAFYVSVGMRF
mgnify:CR=1 FL=1